MSIRKHNEFLEYLFTYILKKPIMSEYYSECEQTGCHRTQHLGGCRRLCYNCNGIKYITIPPLYHTIRTYRVGNCIPHTDPRLKVSRTPKELETITKGLHTWYELESEPKCDSCKYAEEWKRKNWGKYAERAIRGGAKERKELRKIFYKEGERLAVRKLLTFFNCNTTIPMRDSLSGVIDYMCPV